MEANEWFHGQISRQCAVALLKEDGDYLVRDCISRPGEFVLTCMSSGKVLHFKLNQIEDEENGGCFWQFEGEFFNSITELIDYHVNSGQPISNGSQAIISKPIKNNVQCSSIGRREGDATKHPNHPNFLTADGSVATPK